ncbi:ATP-grasp domain-containing protein [Streptomyces sp. NPDC004126]|uniref:ATP-grasp domain-containing protein n=1 Tax=Streptomyces sp. NPDC004126 TaxID=3390695 RepID=UPI003D01FF40
MSTVAVVVFPNSGVRPHDIAGAARACGLSPVYVALTGALDEREHAEYAALGPVIESDEHAPELAAAALSAHAPSGVTTFSEGLVPFTARLAHLLRLPYHDQDTVVRLTDKRAQRQCLAERGVDAVRSAAVTSRAEALALLGEWPGPAVVKPVRGQSSIDTHFVASAADFPADLTPTPERPFVVEEFLAGRDEGEFGDYVSVESLVVDGTAHTLGVTGKFPLMPPFREHGGFVPSHLGPAEHAGVARLANDAALALGIRQGLVHTEIKLTPQGPRIIEVNGRLGGFLADMYRRAMGIDLHELGIRAACGLPVDVAEPVVASVEFQYFGLSPLPGGGVLDRVDGIEVMLKEPGVVGHWQRLAVGGELPPPATSFFMDILLGSAPDHGAMLETIDRALAHLRLTFTEPDGRTSAWQARRGAMRRIG